MVKNILMLVAPNKFRDEEYFEPRNMFESKGFKVYTASTGEKIAHGKQNQDTLIDFNIYNINPNFFDAIIVVGGSGCMKYRNDPKIHSIIKEFDNNNKLIAAVNIGPKILAYSNVLKHKMATIWNKDGLQHHVIENFGGKYVNRELIEDKNIITAHGGNCIKPFSVQIVNWLNTH